LIIYFRFARPSELTIDIDSIEFSPQINEQIETTKIEKNWSFPRFF